MRRRAIHPLLLSTAAVLAAAAPCAAQVDARLDAAVAYVKYDGYLSSGAAVLAPSMTWRSRYTTVAARGTLLLFESGHTSLQGLFTASTFSPSPGPVRVELAAEGGASSYADVATFVHTLGHVRVHLMADRWGMFAGALGGVVASTGAASGATGVATGLWARVPAGGFEITWTRVAVRDTAFGDWQGRTRWQGGVFDVEAVGTARATSRGGRTGIYGSASVAVRLKQGMELVFAGGGYPSDPVRGTIPGRFVSVGARLALGPSPALAVMRRAPGGPLSGARGSGGLLDARVAVEQVDGRPALVVYVTGAHRVEAMGDFSDWQPVELAAAGDGRYRCDAVLPSGVQRFNVRLDGGPWGVPDGAALAADDFGGSVGVLVVP